MLLSQDVLKYGTANICAYLCALQQVLYGALSYCHMRP